MGNMTEQLVSDHEKVSKSLESIENALDISNEAELLKELETHLNFFIDFTCKEHHVEEEKLLAWLIDQNPKSDKDVVNRITSEHMEVERKVMDFLDRVTNFKPDEKSTLLSEIEDFIRMYRQHTEREEKFIFLIAESVA
jgi:hemerythrin-like domain-containing protein